MVEALTASGDIALRDGRLLRPLGIAFADSSEATAALRRQIDIWKGRLLRLDVGADARTDRWRRILAWAMAEASVPGAPPVSLTQALLGDGAGLADPAGLPRACHAGLFAAEQGARRARRGLWASQGGPLIDANQPAAGLQAQISRYVVFEGRVRRVKAGRQRSFVDFGRYGSGAAALAIPKRALPLVLPLGLSLDDLKGKRIRARGLLEWRAERPYMTLDTAGSIEVVN